jgi:hypothetical protein
MPRSRAVALKAGATAGDDRRQDAGDHHLRQHVDDAWNLRR